MTKHKHKKHEECSVCTKPKMEKLKAKEHKDRVKALEKEFERYCACLEETKDDPDM